MASGQKINMYDAVIHTAAVGDTTVERLGRIFPAKNNKVEIRYLTETGTSGGHIRQLPLGDGMYEEMRRATPQDIQSWFDGAFLKLKKHHANNNDGGFSMRHAFVDFSERFEDFSTHGPGHKNFEFKTPEDYFPELKNNPWNMDHQTQLYLKHGLDGASSILKVCHYFIMNHSERFDDLMRPEMKKLVKKFQTKTPDQLISVEKNKINHAVTSHINTFLTNISYALSTPNMDDTRYISEILVKKIIPDIMAKAVVMADDQKAMSGMGMGG